MSSPHRVTWEACEDPQAPSLKSGDSAKGHAMDRIRCRSKPLRTNHMAPLAIAPDPVEN